MLRFTKHLYRMTVTIGLSLIFDLCCRQLASSESTSVSHTSINCVNLKQFERGDMPCIRHELNRTVGNTAWCKVNYVKINNIQKTKACKAWYTKFSCRAEISMSAWTSIWPADILEIKPRNLKSRQSTKLFSEQ